LFGSDGFVSSFYVLCERDVTVICALNSLVGVGGTSASAPAMAGIMALVNQKTGSAQGMPGPVLYKLASKQPGVFHDTPPGSTIAVPCVTGTPNCVTQTVGHGYGILSGFDTGTAYDLATGLGSVDVAQLVNNWSSITFNTSTTSLSLNSGNPVNVKHGAAVPVGVTVNPTAATGNVALMVSPGTPGTPGFDALTLSSGAVNNTTTLLPGGTYSVIAHYGGDSNYGGSYSNSVPVNVTAETSKTLPDLVTLDINRVPTSFNASSARYGSGYAFVRVDVGDANASVSPTSGIASTCSIGTASCPTGNVTLSTSGTPLNGMVLPLNSEGYAEDQNPVPGSYALSASYAGDPSYSSSTGTANFTINKASTTASAAVAGLPVEYGNFEQINAGISTTSNGIAPSGTFQFLVDGSPIGSAVPVYESGAYNAAMNPPYAWADAISSTEFLSVGQHTLSVQYSGDAYYAGSTSPAAPVTVGKAQPFFLTYGWNASQPVYMGQTVSPFATMHGSNAGVAPTGAMTFYDNGTAMPGPVTFSPAAGTVTGTTSYTLTTPGTHNFTADYSGDSNYFSATTGSVPATITVLGPVSVTPASSVVIPAPGQSASIILAVTPNNGFSGTVSLSCRTDPAAKESGCGLTSGSSTGTSLQVAVGPNPVNVSFTVTTTAPHPIAKVAPPIPGNAPPLALATVGVLFLPLVPKRRRILSAVSVLALALCLGACGGANSSTGGGGNTDPGTAQGAYTFTVVAVTGSGSNAITLPTPVSVLVE